ncbi:UNVERIFIED_CONTAM: hypothetical protein Slati_4332000 [Sesamum latifolium]|uniref:Uncharacterized protein n=1 Tax=Sesamum latifolium TaxID=2727402 RepID=A0AAW2SMK0_9LAMI
MPTRAILCKVSKIISACSICNGDNNPPSIILCCRTSEEAEVHLPGKRKMGSFVQIQPLLRTPLLVGSSFLCKDNNSQTQPWSNCRETILKPKRQLELKYWAQTENGRRGLYRKGKSGIVCNGFLLPVDPWAPNIDSQSIASQLFAFSLFPYLGFLYFITKSKSAPRLTLFGFYFLLAFVGATTKVHYGTSLSNVDWLHGGAESLLTLTNIFIVLGLRAGLRKARDENGNTSSFPSGVKEEEKSSL